MAGLASAIKKNVPSEMRLEDQTILLYGREKIGKSTTAAMFEKILMLDLEGGLRNIECDLLSISKWEQYLWFLTQAEMGDAEHLVYGIDTVSKLWEYCRDYVLTANGWAHEQEGGYGRGYDAIRDEFRQGFDRLLKLGKGVVLIAHDVTEEVTKPTKVVSYTHARLDKRCRAIIEPAVEMILFADTETDKGVTRRVLRTKRTEYHEAGDRSGRLDDTLGLGYKQLKGSYEGVQV